MRRLTILLQTEVGSSSMYWCPVCVCYQMNLKIENPWETWQSFRTSGPTLVFWFGEFKSEHHSPRNPIMMKNDFSKNDFFVSVSLWELNSRHKSSPNTLLLEIRFGSQNQYSATHREYSQPHLVWRPCFSSHHNSSCSFRPFHFVSCAVCLVHFVSTFSSGTHLVLNEVRLIHFRPWQSVLNCTRPIHYVLLQ